MPLGESVCTSIGIVYSSNPQIMNDLWGENVKKVGVGVWGGRRCPNPWGQIYHKPGRRLEWRRRMRENPESWRWRERSRQEGRSESRPGLVIVGKGEVGEGDEWETRSKVCVSDCMCSCIWLSVCCLTDCQFTWYNLHFPGVIPRHLLQAGSKKTFADTKLWQKKRD